MKSVLVSAVGLFGLAACSSSGGRLIGDEYEMAQALSDNTRNGTIATLDAERFSRRAAREGLWHPQRFIARANAGIWFVAPYDSRRMPVLFVHGYDGSPRDFAQLIARLDPTRFQAWVYNYPSGLRLPTLADHLESALLQLQIRYRFGCVSIVAHSMGGLVVRGYLLRNGMAERPQCVSLFVSISTPWAGDRAARWAPDLVSTWRDIATGSPYLRSLFITPLPDGTRYCLVFTAADRTVPLTSQLERPAWDEATQVIGYNASHVGVLRDAVTATGLLRLLEQSTQ